MSRPRLGFLGVGWIGQHRMGAIVESGEAEVAAVADASPALAAEAAATLAPMARVVASLDELLALDLDGIVIATPSALHAEQCIAALERGVAVFCQKPLGRSGEETHRAIAAARSADRLLGVDLSYRHTAAVEAMRRELPSIGELYAADLVFHNAYGPDKPWFYDARQSGGGCLIDLGIHLVDLGLWMFGNPRVRDVRGRLFAKGAPFVRDGAAVEDHALLDLELESGAAMRVACSWNLSAGRDAEIGATFYGTRGAVSLHNEHGSFYDFTAERFEKTSRRTLASPPDAWGGRAAVAWVRQLARSRRFDESIASLEEVARVLDAVYGMHERRSGFSPTSRAEARPTLEISS
ncbi:MAG TPA: Gfo/Idh/MocA family oxidoreductase [Thermoanaerobaculia bacterium]|nr:Gfo/Idh/MocA family oxidoreductase [Thermoanaerobaculia bacterium]